MEVFSFKTIETRTKKQTCETNPHLISSRSFMNPTNTIPVSIPPFIGDKQSATADMTVSVNPSYPVIMMRHLWKDAEDIDDKH